MYKWYRSLIAVRKTNPVLTEGELVSCKTDDESGMIEMVRKLEDKEIRVIFNGKNQLLSLNQYKGMEDKITGEIFAGEVAPYSAVLF